MQKSKKIYILYGVFGLIILFVAYWGFNFLRGSSLLNENYEYYVYYDRIEGLNTSSPVMVNGYKVGQVKEIEFLPQEGRKLKVTLEITNKFLLPESTIARINSMDLLGSKGVDLLFDDNSTLYHKPGDVLKGEVEQSLKDQVSLQMLPIKNQAENLMKELSNAIEIISYIFNEETRENLDKSFASIRNTVANLEHATYNLDTLLSEEAGRIARILADVEYLTSSLRENSGNISNIMNNLSDFSDTLVALQISRTVLDINSALDKFNSVMDRVNRGEGTIGKLLNDEKLAIELENAVGSLDKLLIDVRLNPKKYVNFSLIRFGRTINVTDESELSPKDKKKIEKQKRKNDTSSVIEHEEQNDENIPYVYFVIQIKSTTEPISSDSPEFKNYDGVIEKFLNGRYKYFMFIHEDPSQTSYFTEILKEDFPDAFPVAFMGSEQIPYSKGIELTVFKD
ncbi:MAG: MlaD family protein [Bacteroidales bacterium]|jgi:phospholipid/cholesterol/gamma-HCH transport system substrate-binding protein|nr:MlaD family protein [Bacteroidales bacterium]